MVVGGSSFAKESCAVENMTYRDSRNAAVGYGRRSWVK